MKKLSILILSMMSSFAFAGGGSSIGLGNPASRHCIELGGETLIEDSSAGQVGFCVIDEWTLFTKMNEAGIVLDHPHPDMNMPNPAAANCVDAGGSRSVLEEAEGQRGICTIEEWHLFQLFNSVN